VAFPHSIFLIYNKALFALKNISAGKYNQNYIIDRSTGEYRPENIVYKYEEVFSYN